MNWPEAGKRWGPILVGVGLCAASFGLNAWAWQAGREASWVMLLQCHVLALLVLLAAWWAVFQALTVGCPAPPARSSGRQLLAWTGGVVIVAGCVSFYPASGVVLVVLGLFFFALLPRRHRVGPEWKGMALRAALAVMLFEVTFNECATRSQQAMLGFGERIETHGGSERLMAWAKEVLAATLPGQGRTIAVNEVPDFVVDMMGNIPGWPWVNVYNGDDPEVMIANGSGYGFLITVRPKHAEEDAAVGGVFGFHWRPGIDLGTASK
jgi:hypothetical protein